MTQQEDISKEVVFNVFSSSNQIVTIKDRNGKIFSGNTKVRNNLKGVYLQAREKFELAQDNGSQFKLHAISGSLDFFCKICQMFENDEDPVSNFVFSSKYVTGVEGKEDYWLYEIYANVDEGIHMDFSEAKRLDPGESLPSDK